MAKWGEGDPRWLVDHRDDGHNVNGWHWEEKDRMKFSKDTLEALLVGLTHIAEGAGMVEIKALKDITGEAAITTRKGGKKFAVYDMKVTVGWEGQLAAVADKTFKGEVKLTEFASTNEPDEYLFEATVEGSGANNDKCKALALAGLKPLLLSKLAKFVKQLDASA